MGFVFYVSFRRRGLDDYFEKIATHFERLRERLHPCAGKFSSGRQVSIAGKTTISLSLMHLARKKYGRVGFNEAIGPKWIEFNGKTVDKDAAMFSSVFGVEEDVSLMSPVTLTRGRRVGFLTEKSIRPHRAERSGLLR